MTKLLQESPVFITCPACNKVQHKKLKWMRGHKSLKCEKCKCRIELAGKEFKTQLAETAKAIKAFEQSLMQLNKGPVKSSKKAKTGAKKDKKKSAAKQGKKKRHAKQADAGPAGKKTLPGIAATAIPPSVSQGG